MKTIKDGSAQFVVRDKRMQALVDMFYPVGTVYATTSSTKPEFMNYGKWEQFAKGRTLVGAGTGTDSNNLSMTFNAGDVGGEYKHQLSVGEMPSHTHALNRAKSLFALSDTNIETTAGFGGGRLWENAGKNAQATIANSGGSNSHNNIQPYSVVYYYRRIN